MTVCYWCGAKDTLTDIGKELDDGKHKMVQCRNCKNAYYVLNKEKVNKTKPLTNEEWLRQCTTMELAEFIRKQRDDWSDGWYSDCHRFEEIVEWLKEIHE